MPVDRNKIEVVRCPAIGGACVEISVCKGMVNNELEVELAPCPYYLADRPGAVRCTYHPRQPKLAMRKDNQTSRPSVMVTGQFRVTADRVFALQVHAGKRLGPEWESARVNII